MGFSVVLATPDDEGHRADHADEKTFRARQNVVFGIGYLDRKVRSKEGGNPTQAKCTCMTAYSTEQIPRVG